MYKVVYRELTFCYGNRVEQEYKNKNVIHFNLISTRRSSGSFDLKCANSHLVSRKSHSYQLYGVTSHSAF